jgi:hypothetical protein
MWGRSWAARDVARRRRRWARVIIVHFETNEAAEQAIRNVNNMLINDKKVKYQLNCFHIVHLNSTLLIVCWRSEVFVSYTCHLLLSIEKKQNKKIVI